MQSTNPSGTTAPTDSDEFVAIAVRQLEALRSQREPLVEARAELTAQIDKVDKQIGGLKSYLWSATGDAAFLVAEDADEDAGDAVDGGGGPKQRRSRLRGRPRQIADAAERILASRGERAEMHLQELTREVIASGDVWHESKDEIAAAAQVSGALNADSRFVRPHQQGHYGLSDEFPEVKHSVGERKRGRKTDG